MDMKTYTLITLVCLSLVGTGCEGYFSPMEPVYDNKKPVVSIEGPTTAEVGDLVTYTCNAYDKEPNPNNKYEFKSGISADDTIWKINDIKYTPQNNFTNETNYMTIQFTPQDTNIYNITVKVSDKAGNEETSSLELIVNE
jgi:hypothetical protein